MINRRRADSLPLLPVSETQNRRTFRTSGQRVDPEERLERLLTPTELDIVHHRRAGMS